MYLILESIAPILVSVRTGYKSPILMLGASVRNKVVMRLISKSSDVTFIPRKTKTQNGRMYENNATSVTLNMYYKTNVNYRRRGRYQSDI